jgi:hypothetical protein
LVNRRTFVAKRGCLDEVVQLLKAAGEKTNLPHRYRLYVSNLGPFDTLALEIEVENLAEYERVWTAIGERIAPEVWEKWSALTETGGANEIWTLAEWR